MPEVKLFISPTEDGHYQVVVNGEGFLRAENTEVSVRLKGEDIWFDDTLPNPWLGFPPRVAHDGTFSASAIVDGETLNEDWGEDEIYVMASVEGYGDFRSNTVSGDF